METCTGEALREAVAAFLRSDLISGGMESFRLCPNGIGDDCLESAFELLSNNQERMSLFFS